MDTDVWSSCAMEYPIQEDFYVDSLLKTDDDLQTPVIMEVDIDLDVSHANSSIFLGLRQPSVGVFETAVNKRFWRCEQTTRGGDRQNAGARCLRGLKLSRNSLLAYVVRVIS